MKILYVVGCAAAILFAEPATAAKYPPIGRASELTERFVNENGVHVVIEVRQIPGNLRNDYYFGIARGNVRCSFDKLSQREAAMLRAMLDKLNVQNDK
jgi:hypothetical protein